MTGGGGIATGYSTVVTVAPNKDKFCDGTGMPSVAAVFLDIYTVCKPLPTKALDSIDVIESGIVICLSPRQFSNALSPIDFVVLPFANTSATGP